MSRPLPYDVRLGALRPHRLLPLAPAPPAWVYEIVGDAVIQAGSAVAPPVAPVVLLHAHVGGFTSRDSSAQRAMVAAAYTSIRASLAALAREPVRFWNFIPDLHAMVAPGIDRYMTFNAGRYDVLSADLMAGAPTATASAVGVDGHDLDIYCLASSTGGQPFENPRQTPSWLYSQRYGPLPPFFARATAVTLQGMARLLIGGTASVVGEESAHRLDPGAQLDETLQNLAALVVAAREGLDRRDAMERLVELRAYVRHDDHGGFIADRLAGSCPRARRIEMVRACICRPELLVEIEAVADLTR